MKTKKLTPRNAAPVKRENVATVAQNGNAISAMTIGAIPHHPFAGDDAE